MNRFVSHKSILSLLVAWVVTIAMFADGANLDDIASGTLVLHDDDQVTQTQGSEPTVGTDQGIRAQQAIRFEIPARSAKPASMPATPARIVIDQDSPSLAAEWCLGAIFESLGVPDLLISARQTPPAHDALYLQYCTLLI